MDKWEYMVLDIPAFKGDLERDLNIHGGAGWDLISIIDQKMVLKRKRNW